MTAEDFHRIIKEKLDRRPFQAFAVELNDGRRVEIDRPKTVAIRGGVAACATRDCPYVRLDCEEVEQIVDFPVAFSPV